MKKSYLLVLGVLFLMVFSLTALAVQVEEVEQKTFPLSQGGFVSVESIAGDILIHSWDKEEARVVATKWAKAFSRTRAEELLEVLEVEVSSKEDRLQIATRFPWWKDLSPLSSVRIDYELWIPRTAQATADSTSGSILIEERDNSITVETTSGNIELKGARGQIRAISTSGNIYVGQSQGNIVLQSTSGKIEVEALIGDVEVKTTSNNITLDRIEGIVKADSTSGRIKILDSRGGASSIRTTSADIWVEFKELEETLARMEFHSTSGDILLMLPEDIGATIEADTTSGRIRTEFPVLVEGTMARGELRGTIGDGGIRIKMHSTSGDISLQKA